MIKSIFVCSVLAITALNGSAQAAAPDPTGTWMRGDGNARVKIARCGPNFCATNIWIGDTSGGEAVGDVLVMSVKPETDSKLTGTAFDRKRNMNYSMEMTVQKSSLTSRGCVLAGVVCKNVSWTRVR
jgi:uncharacterized protein (DUF2147 family)